MLRVLLEHAPHVLARIGGSSRRGAAHAPGPRVPLRSPGPAPPAPPAAPCLPGGGPARGAAAPSSHWMFGSCGNSRARARSARSALAAWPARSARCARARPALSAERVLAADMFFRGARQLPRKRESVARAPERPRLGLHCARPAARRSIVGEVHRADAAPVDCRAPCLLCPGLDGRRCRRPPAHTAGLAALQASLGPGHGPRWRNRGLPPHQLRQGKG